MATAAAGSDAKLAAIRTDALQSLAQARAAAHRLDSEVRQDAVRSLGVARLQVAESLDSYVRMFKTRSQGRARPPLYFWYRCNRRQDARLKQPGLPPRRTCKRSASACKASRREPSGMRFWPCSKCRWRPERAQVAG